MGKVGKSRLEGHRCHGPIGLRQQAPGVPDPFTPHGMQPGFAGHFAEQITEPPPSQPQAGCRRLQPGFLIKSLGKFTGIGLHPRTRQCRPTHHFPAPPGGPGTFRPPKKSQQLPGKSRHPGGPARRGPALFDQQPSQQPGQFPRPYRATMDLENAQMASGLGDLLQHRRLHTDGIK